MSTSEDKERVYEKQAQKILKYLKSDLRYDSKFMPRPFFFEFTGSPSAGKTTTITELDKFLRRQGFRVLCPQEGAEVIRHIERTTPLYNIRTGMYATELLIDISMGNLYDIVIFDRCIFDAYCWMEYWDEKKKLRPKEKQTIQSFFLSRFFTDKLDAVYFMICDSETAMKRELKIALSKKHGETTNPKTLQTLVKRFENAYKTLSPNYSQLHLLDTTNFEEKAMIEYIATHALNVLEKKIQSGS